MASMFVVLLSLVRLVGQLHLRIGPAGAMVTNTGPEVGAPFLPSAVQRELPGTEYLSFPRRKDLLIVFVSPLCAVCSELTKSLIPFAKRNEQLVDILIVSDEREPVAATSNFARPFTGLKIGYIVSPQLATAAKVAGTPFAVWLDAIGIVRAKGVVNHTEHLESLRNARDTGFASLDKYLESTQPMS